MSDEESKGTAIKTFNRCWELLDTERTVEDDHDLIENALTSRFHWKSAGGAREMAIADWMVSRAFAAIGYPKLSLEFANSAFDQIRTDFPHWLKASLHEGLARAHAANGDRKNSGEEIFSAIAELEFEEDDEDADMIRKQISELTK